jgi:hypothetical protein
MVGGGVRAKSESESASRIGMLRSKVGCYCKAVMKNDNNAAIIANYNVNMNRILIYNC